MGRLWFYIGYIQGASGKDPRTMIPPAPHDDTKYATLGTGCEYPGVAHGSKLEFAHLFAFEDFF